MLAHIGLEMERLFFMKSKFYEYRCPWCGEKVLRPLERYITTRRCTSCGRLYRFYWSKISIALEALTTLGVLLNIKVFMYLLKENIVLSMVFLIFSFWLLSQINIKKPLIKVKENYQLSYFTDIIKHRAVFQIPNAIKYYFVNNAIYPICLINEQGQRVSEYICVCLSEVQINKDKVTCCISDLEFGEKIPSVISENWKIVIFVSKECSFNGILTL